MLKDFKDCFRILFKGIDFVSLTNKKNIYDNDKNVIKCHILVLNKVYFIKDDTTLLKQFWVIQGANEGFSTQKNFKNWKIAHTDIGMKYFLTYYTFE